MTDKRESWVEQYRPDTFSDIQGNNKNIKKIRKWANEFERGDQGILLVGDQGTGKTSTAHVVANYMDWPINEINASDSRKTEDIERMAESINSTPADADWQLVILDEMDSHSGRVSKKPLYDALDNPKNPVIAIANDKYDVPGGIKSRMTEYEFKLGKRSRKAKIKKIAEAEDLDIGQQDIEDLADRPDLRSAIHDLQIWSTQDTPPGSDQREIDLDEFDAIDNILRGKKEIGNAMTPDDLVLWLDENLSKEFRGVEAMVAYDCLSRADIWLDRARREDYRFWKYAGELGEQTAEVRLTEPWDGWLDKDFPEWFRHKAPNPESEKPEARLYRKLKDFEGGTYQFSGSFSHFLEVLLPILQDLPLEERLEMALNYSLDADEMEALDITKQQYNGWAEGEVPEERQKSEIELNQSSALDW